MAEEKLLFEVDLKTKEAEKSAEDLKAKISDLTADTAKLKLENKALEAEYKKVAKEQGVNSQSAWSLQTQIVANNTAIASNNEAIKSNRSELSAVSKELKQYDTISNSASGSINQQRAQLAVLTKQYNSLSQEQRDNSKTGQDLQKQIKGLSDGLKANESAVGDNRRNVGNYEEAIKQATAGLFPFQAQLSNTARALGVSTAATNAKTSALGKLRIALLAIPILAIVAALLSLVQLFKRSEQGSEALDRALAFLKGAFNALLQAIRPIRDFLIRLFEDPQQALKDFGNLIKDNIINRFVGLLQLLPQLGKAIGLLFTGQFAEAGRTATDALAKVALGVTDITERLGKFGANVAEQAKAFTQIERAIQVADQALQDFQNTEQATRLEIDRLLLASRNRTISERERIALLEKASGLEKGLATEAIRLEGQRVAAIARRNEFLKQSGIINDAEEQELIDARGRLIKAEGESLKVLEKIQVRKDALAEKDIENQRKIAEERAKTESELNAILNGILLDRELEGKSQLDKELIEIERKFQKGLELARAKAEAELLITTEIERLKNEARKKAEEERLKNVKDIEDKIKAVLIQSNKEQTSKEIEALNERFATRLLLAQRNGENLNDVLQRFEEEKNQILAEQNEVEIQAIRDKYQVLIDEATKFGLDVTALETARETQIADTEILQRKRVKDAVTQINDEILNEEIALVQKRAELATQVVNAVQGALSLLASSESDFLGFRKAAAFAQIIIDSAEAISAVTKQNAKTSVTPIDFAIRVATAIATVVANIAKAKSLLSSAQKPQPPQFNTGGLVVGSGTGKSDSIVARVSNGESVINAKSTSMFKPLLSAINVAGGGKSFADTSFSRNFADGGFISDSTSAITGLTAQAQARNNKMLAKEIARQMPNQVLVVEQVNAAQKRITKLHERGKL